MGNSTRTTRVVLGRPLVWFKGGKKPRSVVEQADAEVRTGNSSPVFAAETVGLPLSGPSWKQQDHGGAGGATSDAENCISRRSFSRGNPDNMSDCFPSEHDDVDRKGDDDMNASRIDVPANQGGAAGAARDRVWVDNGLRAGWFEIPANQDGSRSGAGGSVDEMNAGAIDDWERDGDWELGLWYCDCYIGTGMFAIPVPHWGIYLKRGNKCDYRHFVGPGILKT